ncbi:MAG: NYN domain-containing protein [Defluviitaleaceae bacterium]|nr:NYN domain-containing protein [Defluviitaleaceae bacterium]
MLCNTAIFYDIENLMGLFSGKTNTVLHLDEIYRRVLEMEGVHGVSIQRAYADWSLPLNRNLRGSVLQVGIEPIQIFNTNMHDKVKNSADVSLIIDVVDLIARQPEIENYVIASGDGIFAFLAKKLHERGKRVIGCGFDRITNIIFRNACDYFIALEKSDASIIAVTNRRKGKSVSASITVSDDIPVDEVQIPAPAAQAPAALKVPSKFAKTKYSEALVQANIGIWKDIGDSAGCFHIVRKLVEALFVESTKDLPGLEVSVFVTYLGHYLPGFKVTRHGFKRVGEFMRFILTGSPYCVYSVEDNVLLMASRAAAKGNIMEDVKGLLITMHDGSRYNSIFNVPSGESFIYSITPPAKEEKPPAKRGRKPGRKPKAVVEAVAATEDAEKPKQRAKPGPKAKPKTKLSAVPVVVPDIKVEGSIRKWIKTQFEALSEADALPLSEVRRLTSTDYCQTTFGVRNSILREIETRSKLDEQRTANGKIKYWKESFRFNGRTYLIYKEWVASLHQERFVAWLAAHKK